MGAHIGTLPLTDLSISYPAVARVMGFEVNQAPQEDTAAKAKVMGSFRTSDQMRLQCIHALFPHSRDRSDSSPVWTFGDIEPRLSIVYRDRESGRPRCSRPERTDEGL